jgi:uncharacterized protein
MERSPVVLDTNVFVAAGFNPRSASAEILEAVEQKRLRMVWNDATRKEIERILQQIPPLSRTDVSRLFRVEDRFRGETHPERFGQVPDREDRKFAALAHAAGAVLISSDEHLLGSHGPASPVLTPAAFWRRTQSADETAREE